MTIGRSLYRLDAPGKVTGETVYPGDLQLEGALHAKICFSGKPHARMIGMDLRRAQAVPGVVAIFTARDVPVNEYGLILPDQPVFVGQASQKPGSDISRWEGDQVAIVLAETEEAAERARELIQFEWEILPVVTDPRQAMSDEILVHPERESRNGYAHEKIRKGDMEAGWAAADITVEGVYVTPYQEHAYLQPEAGVGYIDEEGRLTLVTAGQWTHEDRQQIAHALDLPEEQVRIIYAAVGGAFGGREDISFQIALAVAVKGLQEQGIVRPIRLQWSREESIIGHHKRHPAYISCKWGATTEGKLTAVEAQVILDAGAYNYTSNKVLGNAHLMVNGPYEIPNACVDSYAVYTNNPPGGAFRGFGGPQGAFAAESQMNKLAAALGLDPVEIRLKNCLREGSEMVTQTVMPPGVTIGPTIQACATVADWSPGDWPAKSGRQGTSVPIASGSLSAFKTLPPSPQVTRFGRGFACAMKNVGFSFGAPEVCEARVELRGGAEIEELVLYHAGADVGQGAHTAFRQMVAEAAGVPVESVALVVSDTATSGDAGSASASRLTWMAGNAIRGAVESALTAWRNEDRPAIGNFRYVPPPTTALDPETGKSYPNITNGYVAEVVEVSVDIETGHIHVLRVVCANDVGKAVNPNQVEGQIEGAVVQAHGYTLTENLRVQNGRILNPRFSTYLIPGILDIPTNVQSLILEFPDPQGPWGVRGMAEMPFVPYAPAVAAALYDATGVWFDEFPLTPERVRAKLRQYAEK